MLVAGIAAGGLLALFVLTQQPHLAIGQDPAKKAEAPTGAAGDDKGIREAGRAYIEALNKGDVDAVINMWAPDADYIDESGKQTRGKEAIAAIFKKTLPELKGAKWSGTTNSLRFLRPEVAMEDGTLESISPDGTKASNRFAVVWVKSGDKWLIGSARDLPVEVDELPSLAYPQLKPLEWLVGEWQDSGPKSDVNLVAKWAPNKSFLVLDYTIKREGDQQLDVNMRIGWDEVNGLIRSWVFDSNGGFGEGYWERDGNRWVVGCAGILADGGSGGATNIWEFVDQNNFTWRSVDRDVDGQPIADAEVKFVRQGAKGGEARP
jgi:uncharacterized protein (TIGR02246 family)